MNNTQTRHSEETNPSTQMSFLINDPHPASESKIAIIEILTELKDWLVPQTLEENENLRNDILKNGIREPLCVWAYEGRKILADGHNRYEIAIKHNVPFTLIEMQFENLEAVKDWMVSNQASRRNMTKEQQAYYIGWRYDKDKKNKDLNLTMGKNFPSGRDEENVTKRTSSKIGEEYDFDEKTIRNFHAFYLGVEKIKVMSYALGNGFLYGKAPMSIACGYAKRDVPNVTTYQELKAGLKGVVKPVSISSEKKQLVKKLHQLIDQLSRKSTSDRLDKFKDFAEDFIIECSNGLYPHDSNSNGLFPVKPM